MSTQHYDVIVVGGGILGMAHAWAAARRKLSVAVLERSLVDATAAIPALASRAPTWRPSSFRWHAA